MAPLNALLFASDGRRVRLPGKEVRIGLVRRPRKRTGNIKRKGKIMKNLDKNELAAIQGGEIELGTICLGITAVGLLTLNVVVTTIGLICTGYDFGRLLGSWD